MDLKTQEPILTFCCILLGGVAGGLIAFPIASQTASTSGPLMLVASIGAGFMVGYRRRNSRAFLYFCLFVVITLLTLILFNM